MPCCAKSVRWGPGAVRMPRRANWFWRRCCASSVVNYRSIEGAISKQDAAWLAERKAQPERALSLAEQADLPDWLVERLTALIPEEADLLMFARALNQPAPLDLRVNVLKANRADVLAQLEKIGYGATACPLAPEGIRLVGRPALSKHPLFLSGDVEVQDEGSQLIGHLLAPKRGEMVVDFCAGAGGKTLLLGALMRSTGRLYAFDVSEKRLIRLKPRLARSGLSNVHPAAIAHENDQRIKRLAGKCDRVLVDAPCSGLGTLRRNPDLKWRQTPASVAELTVKQANILAAAAKLLKPGGRLVYATCSFLPEENERHRRCLSRRASRSSCAAMPARCLAAQGIALDLPGPDLQLAAAHVWHRRLLRRRAGTHGMMRWWLICALALAARCRGWRPNCPPPARSRCCSRRGMMPRVRCCARSTMRARAFMCRLISSPVAILPGRSARRMSAVSGWPCWPIAK